MFYKPEQYEDILGTLFSGLITSKIRIKILMRLFLHPEQQVYLRELSDEFQASPSHIKDELQQLMQSNLLTNKKQGKQINYQADTTHPLYPELNSMVKKALGMDQILESIVQRLGKLESAYLIDDYAQGKDTGLIDLLLIGDIERNNLDDLVRKTENYINRKIRVLVLNRQESIEMREMLNGRAKLLLWQADDSQD